jgi:hypothetical protein
MRHVFAVVAVGLFVAAAGALLTLGSGSLATTWSPLSSGNGWGGQTDPQLARTYYTLGLVTLGFGLVLLAAAAWRWMADGKGYLTRTPE